MSWVNDLDWLLYDLETTSPEPTECCAVTATLVELPASRRDPVVHNWVINPGVPVPDEAAAIHGWTTERVRAEGGEPAPAVAEISGMILDAWTRGIPLLAFNASFDVTVTHYEMGRHLGTGLAHQLGPILDPYVCDKALDRYRKGSRKLGAVCEHYQVPLGEAHQSEADALGAGRVMWRLARVFPELAAMTLTDLQAWQANAYATSAASLEKHIKKTKTKEKAPQEEIDAVSIPRDWPLRVITEERRAA